jgi:glucokinase
LYSIGIDIGGMSAKIGMVQNGEVHSTRTIPTNSSIDYDSFVAQVFTAIEELLSQSAGEKPEMIGISSCGLIDSGEGKITYSNNIRWDNKSIVSDVKERFQVPVMIANDAKCALLAEAVLGAGKDYDRVCMITLGTGVGGAFLTGKKLDIGNPYADASGILGHQTVEAGGRQCTCGRRGCMEAYASATALMAMYQEKTGEEKTVKEIFDLVRAGDTASTEVFEKFRYYLGEGLISIGNVLRPEIIVIGGGISQSADLFIDYLEDYVNNGVFGGKAIPVHLVAAKLGNDAGMIGATLL